MILKQCKHNQTDIVKASDCRDLYNIKVIIVLNNNRKGDHVSPFIVIIKLEKFT